MAIIRPTTLPPMVEPRTIMLATLLAMAAAVIALGVAGAIILGLMMHSALMMHLLSILHLALYGRVAGEVVIIHNSRGIHKQHMLGMVD